MWRCQNREKINPASQITSPLSPPLSYLFKPRCSEISLFSKGLSLLERKFGYYPCRWEVIRCQGVGKKNNSKPESHWLLPVLTGKSKKQSLKPVLWQGPTPLQHPPCNYTLEWLDSEENWRPELRTAAIFSLHHTSVITWEMNSPGSKLLQNSQRKYGSVFQ